MAAQMVDVQPLKRALGGKIYLELTEWNGSKRVDGPEITLVKGCIHGMK
jgi:hypothetical protein